MVLKTAGEHTDGRFALLDQLLPSDSAAPRHVHHEEDQAWYVLDGEATFHCGGEQLTAGAGARVFLPKGVGHAFRVGPKGRAC